MKLFYFFFFLILSSTSVFSMYAGNTEQLISIDNCQGQIEVNVTGLYNIEQGEYELKYCIETLNNSWICDCPEILLVTQLNTINNYTFNIIYVKEVITEDGGNTGGGGSSGWGSGTWNLSIPKQTNITITPTTTSSTMTTELSGTTSTTLYIIDIEVLDVVMNESSINQTKETPTEKSNFLAYFIWVIVILLLIGLYFYWRNRK